MTFNDFTLIEPIKSALATEGYTTPTPIQSEAIPVALKGRDILGCAQTGTGKTAAFAIPILQLLNQQHQSGADRKTIKVLIVTPTRELAIQIGDSFTAYGRNLNIKHTVIFGGVPQNAQVTALQRGVEILIATPGRLLDLMNQKYITLKNISILVLDEADRMLDMGFIHDVKKILAAVPQKRQTLFFSATMPPEIVKLSSSILNQPVKIEVTPQSSTVDIIQQSACFVAKADKPLLLMHILKDDSLETVLVFTRTKHGADKVARILNKNNIKAEAIHGNKTQNNRQRALNNFKNKAIRVLVASDIAARGIDIEELSCVINLDTPNIPETYVHRIGRTGRAGSEGIAYSFCDVDEKPFLRDIEKLIGKKIPVVSDHPFPLDPNAKIIRPEKPARPERKPRPENNSKPQQQKKSAPESRPSGEQNRNRNRKDFRKRNDKPDAGKRQGLN
ncbi:ATP-dependent RNA helicase RhlE [bioreactor metagenome]|uniref:ATP-dependent RNA helicase RhlE n=1 Tax=bioreactor metagenome TaxID=1076179 RepID=A0A644X457_9ZZZZ